MNIVVIVQARTGSTRLPGKILKSILGKSILYRQLERMAAAKLPTNIVVATTTDTEDDFVENICVAEGFNCFRGHPTNLLDRHYKAAKQFQADVAVKIPSDCPLIDPSVIDRVLQYYINHKDEYDFVSNLHPASYPDGNDVEAIPIEILEHAWVNAEQEFELEHTTPYIWDNPGEFRIGNVEWETGLDYSMSHRFTIDYQEDYEFVKKIYEELYSKHRIFTLKEILELLDENPEIMKINGKYSGVNWYRNHLGQLKTIKKKQTRLIK